VARYIAVQPIHFGGALAFAPGHQVPEDHVQRFGYDRAGWVRQVADDFRGDDPSVAAAAPDTTPPDLRAARFVDESAVAVEQAQLAHARGERPNGTEVVIAADGRDEVVTGVDTLLASIGAESEDSAQTRKPRSTTKPATGDTTTEPVTEA
jgi:hypothetical protein